MLEKGSISKLIVAQFNKIKDVDAVDVDVAIKREADNTESYLIELLSQISVVIPPNSIQVLVGTEIGTNVNEIILNDVLK
jgi:hypothetical protein